MKTVRYLSIGGCYMEMYAIDWKRAKKAKWQGVGWGALSWHSDTCPCLTAKD